MKVAVALTGSRGDVQPGLAVALGLRALGHDVRLGVSPNLAAMARRLGLDPEPLGPDSRAQLGSDVVRSQMRSRHPARRIRALQAVATHGWDDMRGQLDDLSDGADVVLTGLLGQELGSAVAERRDIGFAALHYCPVRASSVVPIVPGAQRSPRIQSLAWAAGERLRWGLTRAEENRQRAALGLPVAVVDLPSRLRDRGALEIQAYDPALVRGLAEEWGPRRPFTGFLGLDAAARSRLADVEETTDAGLEEWLDAGDPPVYVGFGSMPVPDVDALLATVEGAAADLGVRALVSAGWNTFGDGQRPHSSRDDRVRVVGAVDHAVVLPRCRAAVHHGGAGTTAAALRAGLPSVVCWYSADQPVWGRLLTQLGAGTSLRASTLDRARLRDAAEVVLTPDAQQRAREIGAALIQPEVAVELAVSAIELAG